jgi:hypothetical protein
MRLAHLANLAGISAAMAAVTSPGDSVVAVSGAYG